MVRLHLGHSSQRRTRGRTYPQTSSEDMLCTILPISDFAFYSDVGSASSTSARRRRLRLAATEIPPAPNKAPTARPDAANAAWAGDANAVSSASAASARLDSVSALAASLSAALLVEAKRRAEASSCPVNDALAADISRMVASLLRMVTSCSFTVPIAESRDLRISAFSR